MQLRDTLFCACVAVIVLGPRGARAEGELELRGKYYKERATRVVQPMMDVRVEVTPDVEASGHFLVDSITSASIAAGATDAAFTEHRVEGGGQVGYRRDNYQFGAFGRYSFEPDYQSVFGGARLAVELAQKNTTLGVLVAHGMDSISNAGAQDSGMGQTVEVTGELSSSVASLSLSQVLSPVVVVGVTYDLTYLDGFQENAYRQVIAEGMLLPERVPATRVRHALFASVRAFVVATGTTVFAGYRLYLDDWGLSAHTPEIRVIHELARDLDVHLRYRYHRQSGADFYKPVYDSLDPTVEPFITDDVKLSSFAGQTYGMAVESAFRHLGAGGMLGAMRAKISIDYAVQKNRFGNAVIGQLGLVVPFGD